MWASHHRDCWPELDAAQEPAIAGRRFDVGGFVLNDSFDQFLRQVSEGYLRAAWRRLEAALARYQLSAPDLSWGAPHPGETSIAGRAPEAPSDYIGWTSRQFAELDSDPHPQEIDAQLRAGAPVLRWVTTWRSHKWAIAPDDFRLALQLVEAHCTDELSLWHPDLVVQSDHSPLEPWVAVASAIRERDQPQLERACAEAKAVYSPVGYRIVIRANRALLQGLEQSCALQIPQL